MTYKTFEELENGLLPCPFCDGKARIVNIDSNPEGMRMVITCVNCGATVDHTKPWMPYWKLDRFDAVELWNRRNKVETVRVKRRFALDAVRRLSEIEPWAHKVMTKELADFLYDAGVIEFSETHEIDRMTGETFVDYGATVNVVIPKKEE